MEIFTVPNIIIGFLVVILIFLFYFLRNLLLKVEKYEDVVQDQVEYLQNISKLVAESQAHLKNLDNRGGFESDDEVGEFFKAMKGVQDELNRYMLPENYGKEEIQS